jgi:hypothetical protein
MCEEKHYTVPSKEYMSKHFNSGAFKVTIVYNLNYSEGLKTENLPDQTNRMILFK